MNRYLSACLIAAGFTLGSASAVGAQQRTLTGRVSNAVNEEPVAGATVGVVGTPIAAVTDARGQFSLAAPDGGVTVVVRAIGYKRRTIPVGPEQTSLAVTLDPDIFNLEAVVVTGQATAVEQRNLPNAVTTVSAEQLNRAPAQTIEGALQGKVPGALIQANSGAPGGGFQLNLRGVSTINGGVNPLIVVDGLVISNAAIPNGMNAVTASQAGGNPTNQDDPVSRIADLNPEDIERIEVLKGASAAAVYGSKATNGVVVITTRRGTTGAPRFHISQRFGTTTVAHEYGSRRFADSVEADAAFGGAGVTYCTLPGGACPFFDNEGFLYDRKALSTETSANVTGGNDQTSYFVSGLILNDQSIAANTGYQKQSLRINLDQRLSPKVGISVNSNVVHSLAKRGISNNDNAGTSPHLVFPFTPSFVDLRPHGSGVLDYPTNPFERSNPLQTFQFLKNDETVWRFLGTSTVRFSAVSTERQTLQLIATGGLDYFSQHNLFYSPPELQYEPNDGQPGTVVLGKAANLNLNLTSSLVHSYTPGSGGLLATTSAGFQFERRDLDASSLLGRTLLPGQENPDEAASLNPFQDNQLVKDLGLYAQEELLMMDQRLLLTAGIRADRSSNNGDTKKLFSYPKVAASYRLTQQGGDEIKLRGAWGQTGNQPLFGMKYVQDTTGSISGPFGLQVGARAGFRLGDPNIKPERQTEIEAGIDAALLSGRASVSLTFYHKGISDLLLEQTMTQSSGFLTRVFNGGKLRNRGVEASVAYSPIQRNDLTWIVRSTFFMNRSKVLELPAGIDSFQTTAGFSRSLGVFQITPGQSATMIVGSDGHVGDANPDFQMSFSTDANYRAWTFGMLWDWKKGGDVINLTQLLYDAGQTSPDYVGAGSTRISQWAGGATSVYVQDGSYLKLREVTLSYTLPAKATSSVFGGSIKSARLRFAGRNLIRITDYKGLDPEVSNFGNQAIARNIEVAPFPPSRSFFVSVDLDF